MSIFSLFLSGFPLAFVVAHVVRSISLRFPLEFVVIRAVRSVFFWFSCEQMGLKQAKIKIKTDKTKQTQGLSENKPQLALPNTSFPRQVTSSTRNWGRLCLSDQDFLFDSKRVSGTFLKRASSIRLKAWVGQSLSKKKEQLSTRSPCGNTVATCSTPSDFPCWFLTKCQASRTVCHAAASLGWGHLHE